MVLKSVKKKSCLEFKAALISDGASSIVLGIKIIGTVSDENVDVPDVKNGNRLSKCSEFFQCPDSTKIVHRDLKQRHSDSLHETEAYHQASRRFYFWNPES